MTDTSPTPSARVEQSSGLSTPTGGPVITAVLGPVGWADGTLSLVAAQIRRAFGDISGEIVAATGQDAETEQLEQECRRSGVRHISYFSEHRLAPALNNGAAAARGDYLMLIDEDFLLADGAIEHALRRMEQMGADAVQLECREGHLAPSTTLEDIDSISAQRYLESLPRPRNNRGIAVLMKRADFMRIRGFDERPSFGTHLGLDLIARIGRAGLVFDWLDSPDVAAYHFFGAHCTDTRSHGMQSARSRTARHEFVEDDRTIYRNLTSWSVPSERRDVLVSVAVSTRNRCEYLAECIDSVLAQTFPDFELIIVDDGSTDRTRDVVESYQDPRVVYLHQDPAGISAGRNRAANSSRGFFTAVHDDDDIMLPWRLEVSLQNIIDEYSASYGSWANFDNETGDMVLHVIRRGFSPELNAFNGQGPGHATWLLPTEAVRKVRYDEHLSSSVDHNLASRLAWSGLRWKHTEKVMFLRRIHPTQVSAVDGGRQRTTAVLTRFANRFATSEPGRELMIEKGGELTNPVIAERDDLFAAFGAYLPDHLVHRTLVLANNVTNKVVDLDLYQKVGCLLAEHDLHTGKLRLELGELPGITWKDLVTLRESGVIGVRIDARLKSPEEVHLDDTQVDDRIRGIPSDRGADRARELVMDRLESHFAVLRKKSPTSVWLIADADILDEAELAVLMRADRAYEIRASGDHGTRFGLKTFGFEQSSSAMHVLPELSDAIEYGRVLIADAEQQPALHVAQMLRDATSRTEATS